MHFVIVMVLLSMCTHHNSAALARAHALIVIS